MKIAHTVMAWEPERQRQMLMCLAAGVLGLAGVFWLFGPDMDEWATSEAELAQWQARLPPTSQVESGSGASAAAVPGTTSTTPWPIQDQAPALWTWLQQGLQAQGLKVLALRPQILLASNAATSLPEQTVWLQLQGRWPDWLALSAALAAHAPWWSVTQWQAVPSGDGGVRIDLQARVGWRPGALQAPNVPVWTGSPWPVARMAPDQSTELFGLPEAQGLASPLESATAQAAPLARSVSPDPRQWPVHALGLQGVWQQAGEWHAVLGGGLALTVVRTGQRVGQEAYRVQSVGPQGVVLRSPSDGSALHLAWQGDKP